MKVLNKEKTSMYLVMGITGNVGGARAASAEARQTGASTCAQSRESGEVGRPGRGVGRWRLERCDSHSGGAQRCWGRLFVMLPAVWAPSPDYREAKGVIANYVDALSRVVPPRVVALSSMGANRTSGLGMITALSLLGQGFRSLPSPVAFVRAGGFFENFLSAYRPLTAEHYPSSTILQTGNRQWSRQTTSVQR